VLEGDKLAIVLRGDLAATLRVVAGLKSPAILPEMAVIDGMLADNHGPWKSKNLRSLSLGGRYKSGWLRGRATVSNCDLNPSIVGYFKSSR